MGFILTASRDELFPSADPAASREFSMRDYSCGDVVRMAWNVLLSIAGKRMRPARRTRKARRAQ
jgi:hypothetical protein